MLFVYFVYIKTIDLYHMQSTDTGSFKNSKKLDNYFITLGSKFSHAHLHYACRCFAVHVVFYFGCTTVHVAQSTTETENSEPVEK